jgi:hypothetical protein
LTQGFLFLENMAMRIKKIVSGGQTGADRGALDAAIEMGVPHGGWCPKGRLAEDGLIPSGYRLRETATPSYAERTEANVIDSDATVLFTDGPATGGSLQTIEFAIRHGRPWLHVDIARMSYAQAANAICKWLAGLSHTSSSCRGPRLVLNVAGSRESACPKMHRYVNAVVRSVIGRMNCVRSRTARKRRRMS